METIFRQTLLIFGSTYMLLGLTSPKYRRDKKIDRIKTLRMHDMWQKFEWLRLKKTNSSLCS